MVGLSQYVEFFQKTSFEVIETYKGPPFDFIFFDSDASREQEFNMVLERKLFSNNAICMFHDTSAKRYLSYKADPAYVEFLNGLLNKYEGFCFPFSRGFHFFRIGS
jgi:predicted O-methyltransferase YrrM